MIDQYEVNRLKYHSALTDETMDIQALFATFHGQSIIEDSQNDVIFADKIYNLLSQKEFEEDFEVEATRKIDGLDVTARY